MAQSTFACSCPWGCTSYFLGICSFFVGKAANEPHWRQIIQWYHAEVFERGLFGKKGATAVKGCVSRQ